MNLAGRIHLKLKVIQHVRYQRPLAGRPHVAGRTCKYRCSCRTVAPPLPAPFPGANQADPFRLELGPGRVW
jgi:hypothetical protein